MDDCIFCKIVKKEVPAKLVSESEALIAFPDINPSADIHILIVPKRHVDGIHHLTEKDGDMLAEIYTVANQLVKEYNLSDKQYRVVVNGGKAQHVPHLHFHLLGGNLKKLV